MGKSEKKQKKKEAKESVKEPTSAEIITDKKKSKKEAKEAKKAKKEKIASQSTETKKAKNIEKKKKSKKADAPDTKSDKKQSKKDREDKKRKRDASDDESKSSTADEAQKKLKAERKEQKLKKSKKSKKSDKSDKKSKATTPEQTSAQEGTAETPNGNDDAAAGADDLATEVTTPRSNQRVNTPFRRVKEEEVVVHDSLADNTYEGTFGAGGWGAKASADLIVTRGKSFRHEKTKKKRGSYRGGTIDIHTVNSERKTFEDW
eukprot:m.164978 g.164978  ORF g.164978 m.164978 type:complete len:261 (+) comp18119_c0_seq2:75-857(+)